MDEISLFEYYYTLRKRWKVVAAGALLAVFAAGVYILIAPRVYRGQAMLLFAAPDNGSGLASALSGLGNIQGLLGSGQSDQRFDFRRAQADRVHQLVHDVAARGRDQHGHAVRGRGRPKTAQLPQPRGRDRVWNRRLGRSAASRRRGHRDWMRRLSDRARIEPRERRNGLDHPESEPS